MTTRREDTYIKNAKSADLAYIHTLAIEAEAYNDLLSDNETWGDPTMLTTRISDQPRNVFHNRHTLNLVNLEASETSRIRECQTRCECQEKYLEES